jgi:hypothetical protein
MKDIIQKIKKYALAFGLSALALTGCATTRIENKSSIEYAMKILEINEPSRLQLNLPEGYKTLLFEDARLRAIAGVYAGTVKVERTKNGYIARGFYSEAMHPEAMLMALREADTNGDKIITRKEAEDLSIRVYEENAE